MRREPSAPGAAAGSGRGGRAPPARCGRRAARSSCADRRARGARGAAPAPGGSRRRWPPSAHSGRRRAGAPGRRASPAPGPSRPTFDGPAACSCRPLLRPVSAFLPHRAAAGAKREELRSGAAWHRPPDPRSPRRSPTLSLSELATRCRRWTRAAAAGRTPTAAPRRRSASASRRAAARAHRAGRRTVARRRHAGRRRRRCSRARAPRSQTGWSSLAAERDSGTRSRPGGR